MASKEEDPVPTDEEDEEEPTSDAAAKALADKIFGPDQPPPSGFLSKGDRLKLMNDAKETTAPSKPSGAKKTLPQRVWKRMAKIQPRLLVRMNKGFLANHDKVGI